MFYIKVSKSKKALVSDQKPKELQLFSQIFFQAFYHFASAFHGFEKYGIWIELWLKKKDRIQFPR